MAPIPERGAPDDGSDRTGHAPSGAPTVAASPSTPPGWSSPAPDDLGQSGSPGAWLLVWTIVTVKAITVVATILAARSWDAGAMLALMTWPWLLAIGALVAAPLAFRVRLRRVRARRARLIRAEWLVEDRPAAARIRD